MVSGKVHAGFIDTDSHRTGAAMRHPRSIAFRMRPKMRPDGHWNHPKPASDWPR